MELTASSGILRARLSGGVLVAGFERGLGRDERDVLKAMQGLSRQLEPQKDVQLLLDLEGVEYLSSAGLGVLVSLLKKVKAGGGALKLCSLSPSIRELFEVMHLDTIFAIFPQREAALAAFPRAAAEDPRRTAGGGPPRA
jgi:anti-sigma B factor antagonist